MVNDVVATLRQAASHLDAAAALASRAEKMPLPNILFRGRATQKIHAAYAVATAEAMRGVRALEPLGAPLEDARAGVLKQLKEIDPSYQYAIENQRNYTAAQDVPGMLRIHADRLRLRGELNGLEPSVARARLQEEIDAILRVPERELTEAQQWRAGVITGLPDGLRPELPTPVRENYPLDRSAVRGWSAYDEQMTRGEWRNLRVAMQRRELAADPLVTRESLDAELRSIIATADAGVTPEMNERLSIIAGMPDDLRPALIDTPVPWPQHTMAHLSSWNWLPGTSGEARSKYEALRMAVEQERALADPSFTREAATNELMEILSLPDELITPEQLRRTSFLLRLPEHARPDVAALPRSVHGLENYGIIGFHPTTNRTAQAAFDQLRVHLAATIDPERAAAQLKARIDAGERIDIRVITALAQHGDLLERAGLTPDVLHKQAILALRDAGSGGSQFGGTLSRYLELARDTVARGKADDAGVAGLRQEAIEIADRNLERMAGTRADTFGNNPDYAEIGRFVAITELLDALKPATTKAADATTGAENLVW